MELKIDSEAWGALAGAAIFDQMSEESRETVIKQAIQYLLTPEKNRGYGSNKTPLQLAFESALHQAATKAVQEKVANDPVVKQHIDDLLGPLIKSAMETEEKHYSSTLSEAIGNAIGSWLGAAARDR